MPVTAVADYFEAIHLASEPLNRYTAPHIKGTMKANFWQVVPVLRSNALPDMAPQGGIFQSRQCGNNRHPCVPGMSQALDPRTGLCCMVKHQYTVAGWDYWKHSDISTWYTSRR